MIYLIVCDTIWRCPSIFVYITMGIIIIVVIIIIKSVAYSSQGSDAGQLDFCNWLADGSTTDVISITLRQV